MRSQRTRFPVLVHTTLRTLFFLELCYQVSSSLFTRGPGRRRLTVWSLLLLFLLLRLTSEVCDVREGTELHKPLLQFKLTHATVKAAHVDFEAVPLVETFLVCLSLSVVFFGEGKLHL